MLENGLNREQDGPELPERPARQTRTQRRALRTRASIEDAFVAAVSERGYHNVSVEDIAEGADVAKATFYAHFKNKDALLEAAFERLTRELIERVAPSAPPHLRIRSEAAQSFFEQAAQLRELFRVCLKHGRTRSRYVALVADVVEHAFAERAQALGVSPRVPARAAALAFAGAHTALLEGWLDGDLTETAEQMAAVQLALTLPGHRWALGQQIAEVSGREPADGRLPADGRPVATDSSAATVGCTG